VPELPEVETIVRELRPKLVGRRITAIWVGKKNLRRPWNRRWTPGLIGKKIQGVARRGKWILLQLDNQGYLVFHLGMTGQLTVVPAPQASAPHTHVVMDLDRRGMQLRFRDIRRFGCAAVLANQARMESFFHNSGLGPEPFDLEVGYWQSCLARTNRCLKALLLDQRVLAGVGNIYADEALFEARLHPRLLGRKVRSAEAGRLRHAIVTVLNRAIDKRGSSIRDYVDGSGREGEYQNEFRVYGRAGQPCVRCGRPIRRIRLAGRSTYFCPNCQRRERNSKNQEPNSKNRERSSRPQFEKSPDENLEFGSWKLVLGS
jgi:formamidopyrimidine-DNA glycosylase